jgi:hypothetical protein
MSNSKDATHSMSNKNAHDMMKEVEYSNIFFISNNKNSRKC